MNHSPFNIPLIPYLCLLVKAAGDRNYWQKRSPEHVKNHVAKAGNNIFHAMQQVNGEHLPQIIRNENA